jgi:hypothetical protein
MPQSKTISPFTRHLKFLQTLREYYSLIAEYQGELQKLLEEQKKGEAMTKRRIQVLSSLSSKVHLCRLQIIDIPGADEPEDDLSNLNEARIEEMLRECSFPWEEERDHLKRYQDIIAEVVAVSRQERFLTNDDLIVLEAVASGRCVALPLPSVNVRVDSDDLPLGNPRWRDFDKKEKLIAVAIIATLFLIYFLQEGTLWP